MQPALADFVAVQRNSDYLDCLNYALATAAAAMPQLAIGKPSIPTTPPIERDELAALLVAADWFEERGAPEADALRRLAETLKGLNGPAGAILAALERFGIHALPETACRIVDATLLQPSDIVETDYPFTDASRRLRLLPQRRGLTLSIEMELYPQDAAGLEAYG